MSSAGNVLIGQWRFQVSRRVVQTLSGANVILLIQAAMDMSKCHYLIQLIAFLSLSDVQHHSEYLLDQQNFEVRNGDNL